MRGMIPIRNIRRSRYASGLVLRWHTWPTIQQQNIAAHTWRFIGIYVELFGLPRAEVLMWIHKHDQGEFKAGDSPHSAKQEVHGLKEALNEAERLGQQELGLPTYDLTEEEFARCKLCDMLEMWEFCNHEYNLGNRFAEAMVHDAFNKAMIVAKKIGEATRVLLWMSAQVVDGMALESPEMKLELVP